MHEDYSKHYSEDSLWKKLQQVAKTAGSKVVYLVLLLYYAMNESSMSLKAKIRIAAALGYFIFPADAIFDLTPIIGYSDDLGVLLFVLSQVSRHITPETREKAKQKLNDWLGPVDLKDLSEIDSKTD